MRRIEARRRKASALRLRHSQSFANLRQRPSQARVRSTIQRLGRARKPLALSDRLTISTLTRARMRFIALWNSGEVGGVHDRVHQEALRIDKDMPLLAFDFLARIVAGRIDASPPFSALLTLWLSMIAAVGLASREAASRQRA